MYTDSDWCEPTQKRRKKPEGGKEREGRGGKEKKRRGKAVGGPPTGYLR